MILRVHQRPWSRNALSSGSLASCSAFIHPQILLEERISSEPWRVWLPTLSFSFTSCLRLTSSTTRVSHGSPQFAPLNKTKKLLKYSSSNSIAGFASHLPQQLCNITAQPQRLRSLTVASAKGHKMKTHKASAKRFRVTGRGKIVCRRAGKQHLLAKKNTEKITAL